MNLLKYSFLFLISIILTNCARTFYIKKTLKNGALACEGHTCDPYTTSECERACLKCHAEHCKKVITYQPVLVFIDNIEGIEYYDGLVFEVPDNLEYYQAKDFYRYKSVQGVNKKVPHVVFVNKKDMTKNKEDTTE